MPSREDIERDAATELGIELHSPEERAEPAPVEESSEPAVGGRRERRPGRVIGWVRGLGETEPPAVRRQRLEREAAAELGVHDRSEQPVS